MHLSSDSLGLINPPYDPSQTLAPLTLLDKRTATTVMSITGTNRVHIAKHPGSANVATSAQCVNQQ